MILSPLLFAFILYFVILIAIGSYFYNKTLSLSDFMVGDRSVNYWVTAIATQASDMGSWLFLGLPADIYNEGLFRAWAAIGLIIGMYLTWEFVAPKLRMQSEHNNSVTLSSYFAHHYGDPHNYLQLTSALLSILFITFYIASGILGLAILLESAFGIPYKLGMMLSLAIAALYSLIGGFTAIAWCDLFQGVFLMFMIILVPITAWFNLSGGINTIIHNAFNTHKSLTLFAAPTDMLNAILLAAGWGLGYFGQPHILMNFMGIENVASIRYAKRIGMAWQIIVLSAAVAVGIIGIGFFTEPLNNSQLIFVTLTNALFHPFMAGIILCAILAATLSTIDSLILTAGSTIAQDIYGVWIAPNSSHKKMISVSRIAALIISAIALTIAWENNASIYNLVNYAWAGLGSSFGPLIIASLYRSGITYQGAITGMITGGVLSALWPYTLPLVPGFIVNFITMYAISYASKKLNT